MSDDDISKQLGLIPESNRNVEPRISIIQPALENDIELARTNIKDVIDTAMSTFKDLNEIAGQAQNARMYEVLTGMFDSIVNANRVLTELKQTTKEEVTKEGNKTMNLFVGSTSQLAEMLQDMKK